MTRRRASGRANGRKPRTERLENGRSWFRIARREWQDPLDPSFAAERGGRWSPPGSFAALYLNGDLVTARFNFRLFSRGQGYEPEDLAPGAGPVLVEATLPRDQTVADAHTPAGLRSLGLPNTYPLDRRGRPIPWQSCQPIGARIKQLGLRGLHCRSAEVPDRAGRELAWFPATRRSRAHAVERHEFEDWYW